MNNIYEYLIKRNFYNFKDNNIKETNNLSKEEQAKQLIDIMSLLHNKTTNYEKIEQDEITHLYNETKEKIISLKKYYLSYQDYIETKIYFYPEEYLLIRHISKIYNLLDLSLNILEAWYKEIHQESIIRKSIQHRNLNLKNIIIKDKTYLTNWNKSTLDFVIYDFLYFYKNEYQYLNMINLYEEYQRKYTFTKIEQLLLFSLLAIPKKLKFTKSHYNNTVVVKYIVIYTEKTLEFILKYYKENQSTNHHKF